MTVIYNRKAKDAVLHFNATGTANLIGNSSVSTIAANNEVISAAPIRRVWFGVSGTNTWTITRGGQTILVLSQTGFLDFAGAGAAINYYANSDITATLSGGSGFIMLEVSKEGYLPQYSNPQPPQ